MEKKENWKVNPHGEIEFAKHFGSGFILCFVMVLPDTIKRFEAKGLDKATSLELSECKDKVRRLINSKDVNNGKGTIEESLLLQALYIELDNAFMETLLPKEKK